jgi:uncharacterized protein with HEPN domain
MSDLNERDASRLRDMLENARLARQFMQGKSLDDLLTDTLLAYAVVRALEIVGEAANHVTPEARASLPDVKWSNMVGMRNRIVHGYDNINYNIVWDVVDEKLTPLIETLLPVLRPIYPDLDA